MSQVRNLPARADVYDDAQAAALRDLCLNFYDVRATVIEIATRADALRHLSAAEAWRRQLAALEALQVKAQSSCGHVCKGAMHLLACQKKLANAAKVCACWTERVTGTEDAVQC